jgi:hypothetical protein
MKIAEPKNFKPADFAQTMAEKTGVPVENVKVKSMEMKMSVGYSFKGTEKVTQEQAESAIAKSLGIETSQVAVEILGRRLGAGLLGRRLEVETKMKATITMDANNEEQLEKAQEAHEKLADSDKSTAMLKTVQEALKEDAGIEIEVPQVTEEPRVDVKVETEIVAVSNTPVVLPTGDDLEEIAEKAGAEDIELKNTKVSVPTTAVPAKADEDSSFVAVFLTVLAVCLVSFGMIGGFIYWYYRYSTSMAAASNRDDAGADKSHMV